MTGPMVSKHGYTLVVGGSDQDAWTHVTLRIKDIEGDNKEDRDRDDR